MLRPVPLAGRVTGHQGNASWMVRVKLGNSAGAGGAEDGGVLEDGGVVVTAAPPAQVPTFDSV